MQTDIPPKRRLNPFAFPPETNVRFTLLVLAAFMLAMNMSVPMRYVFNPEQSNPFSEAVEFPGLDTPADEYYESAQAEFLAHFGQALDSLVLPVGLMLAALILATAIYRIHPAHIRRQKNLKPLPHDKDPAFHRAIRHLVRLAAISPPPTVELGKGLHSQNGQVFGFRRKYVLRLDEGLRLLLRKVPAVFRAIVLHELAHIVNRDVERAYLAQAFWIATISLAIVPVTVGVGFIFIQGFILKPLREGIGSLDLIRLFTISLPTVLLLFFQVGATLAVVAAIRASLLRIREIYADWRVTLWGAEAPLSNILRRNASKEESKRKNLLWRLHPTAQERLTALQDPTGLFRVALDLPFIAGLLMAFVLAGIIPLVISVTIGFVSGLLATVAGFAGLDWVISNALLLRLAKLIVIAIDLVGVATVLIPILGMGYLLSGTVGLQVQRESIAEMVTGRQGCARYLQLWVPAGLIALGLEVGFLIAPFAQFSSVGVIMGETVTNPILLLLLFPWLIGFTGFTWLGLLYARFFGQRVLGSHVGKSPPKWKRRFLTLTLSGLLSVMHLPFLVGRLVILYQVPDVIQVIASVFFTSLIVALFLYVVSFSATWMLIQVGRFIRPPRCPSCKQITRQKYAVTHNCEHCNQDLAPWLFAAPP